MVDKAAWFIAGPEKMLRQQAFLSHYINARDMGYPHNAAISIGRVGVENTQFLYDLGNRPAFARTAIGQVLSRFQLWGWNSVRFRKNILQMSKDYGFKGKEAIDKFQRLVLIDMFMFAAANALLSSVFESALPAPYNWMQDTAEWLFGDDKKRERAFFGSPIGPFQIITPPIARLPLHTLGAFLTNSWDRFFEYHILTSLPYGRLGREAYKSIKVPAMAPEFIGGIPLHATGEIIKKKKKNRHYILMVYCRYE